MTGRRGAVMVVGATSGAGKSTVVAALCRALARSGTSVAPFKAQNMSNHAAVTADGGEIGRAQAMQAGAARVETDRRMNPILLKPTTDQRSHLVVLGDEVDTVALGRDRTTTDELKPVVLDALDSLRARYPLVVAEGAGGAAEINLLDRDLVNLPLARAAGVPAILVVDIDRGGAFAAAHGTIDLLPPELRATVGGVVINRFRGDASLLDPGLGELEARTGVPVLGVLPWLGPDPLLGVEDSLDLVGAQTGAVDRVAAGGGWRPGSDRPVRIAVVHLPHLANPSDLDPFSVEPDVVVRWASVPGDLADADLIVIPGSRATVADLGWLRGRGLDRALITAAGDGRRIVGVCGGYQLLGRTIDDPIESRAGLVEGLGLLETTTRFEHPKVVRRSVGAVAGHTLAGYQIRFGRPSVGSEGAGTAWLEVDGEPEGARSTAGTVTATSLHGLFDADGFRAGLLSEVAGARGRCYEPAPTGFADALDAQHERLADWVEAHLDLDAIGDLAATADAPGAGPGW